MGFSFKDIFGHQRETGILRAALLNQRVAHAYLFAGNEGVGKMLTARAFARALNCEELLDGDSCSKCASCLAMDAGTHINLIMARPTEGYLRIDQIRDIQKALKYRIERGSKVALIDGADSMRRDAQSAFLKTLEEPPAGTVIVLVASRPSMMLQTIVSRCQHISFSPLACSFISMFLIERKGIGREDADLAAGLSSGSLSMAIKFVEEANIQRAKRYLESLSLLSCEDSSLLLDLASEMSEDEELACALELLKVWLRDAAVRRIKGDGAVFGEQAGWDKADTRGLAYLFSEVENTIRLMGPPRNANKKLQMEVLLMKFLDTRRGASRASL
ncbi:MAG: DNA polymerase III subunit delta' [Deltaproteobacteria bacterium]|nr:DNA polymerase III subunit delta' [Deltaproteobacteria bacterium]